MIAFLLLLKTGLLLFQFGHLAAEKNDTNNLDNA